MTILDECLQKAYELRTLRVDSSTETDVSSVKHETKDLRNAQGDRS